MTKRQLEQIEVHLQKVKTEINDIRYFIANALCKETKDIYQLTLEEKQRQLHLLLSQKEQLLNQLKNGSNG